MEVGHAGQGLSADAMQPLFSAAGLIDFVIVATLLEWAALLLVWRRSRRGLDPATLAWTLLPGLCLLLSARSALLGLPWYSVAMLLSLAGLAHLIDLKRRWTRR